MCVVCVQKPANKPEPNNHLEDTCVDDREKLHDVEYYRELYPEQRTQEKDNSQNSKDTK